MPRPADKSRLRYYPAAVLDRASVLKPVARLREHVIAARAPEVEGLPPAKLRVLVDGKGDPDWFLHVSRAGASRVRLALERAGRDLSGTVLDFGCGCGRTARQWSGLDLHGCDYNARAVAWCQANLPHMRATVNDLEPPAPYPDAMFDVVYAISVLTHLSDELARRWVDDWRRILKPGGVLVVTTIGDVYRDQLNAAARARYDSGLPFVKAARLEGLNACVAHHPPAYVRGTLFRDWRELAFVPGDPAPGFRQDAFVWAP